MSHVGRARAARRERRPDHCRARMSDRLAGRLKHGSGEGKPVAVGKELRRLARRRRQCVARMTSRNHPREDGGRGLRR